MFPERNRQDDCVGLECVPQRLGDDRGSNRPSLRRQRFGRPAARDGHVDAFTGEGVGGGLAYLTESYNCIAHNISPIRVRTKFEKRPRRGQTCAMPPSTARSTPVIYELSSEARNTTTDAISSGLPLRPSGICEVNWATACSACSAVRPVVVAKAGVSIAPGLIQFTRILRSFSSIVQPRAKLRTAALLAA